MRLKVPIQILPIGDVDLNILKNLITQLEKIFYKLEIIDVVPLLDSAYNSKRNQYLSDELLREVKWHATINDGNHILGITMVDLYTHGLNFVFGQAELPGKAAIISLNRLNHHSKEVFNSRMFKEAIHELGHTLGLRHCPDFKCVMHFSNSLKDTDIKNKNYCDRCSKILNKNYSK